MDTADQWPHQEVAPPSDQYPSRPVGDEKKLKPQKDQAPLNCPRCHSTNTKFCYYNNYSLTQPRYFCKACRRYWTAGGSLRNVPVGGGSRKNKRSTSLVSKSGSDDHLSSQFSFQNPNNYTKLQAHDHNQNLNLAFPPAPQEYNSLEASPFLQVPSKIEMNKDNINIIQLNLNSSYSTSSSASTSLSAMELLKLNSSTTGFNSRASHTFVPVNAAPVQNPNMIMQYASGFHFQDFNKPQVGFGVDGHAGNKYEAGQLHRNASNRENINGAADQRLNFPFGAPSSKHIPSADQVDNQDKVDGNPTVYWNGMSSGGSSW